MDRTPKNRRERDSMGEVEVPGDAYYGASTRRAVDNFDVSGTRFGRRFLRALGLLKWAAAKTNVELGLMESTVGEAVAQAALEVAEGALDDHFPVDVFQTGSGTSTNMNANEVIANRAVEILGGGHGERDTIHPNDHVNLGQSSNDVIPTAVHLACLLALDEVLEPGVRILLADLESKAGEFHDVIKTGRTHLQDAAPIRLGQSFRGYAGQMERALRRLEHARQELSEVALGGTAVGTGLNAHPEFAARVCGIISRETGTSIRETGNHFQAQASMDAAMEASGSIRTVAISVRKIADDLRLLSSGPRCGIGELELPAVQPGSSIMPGKVNPVIAESAAQACSQVVANDLAVVQGGLGGHLELNTMLPLIAHNLLESIELLWATTRNLAERCVRGIRATERGTASVERNLSLATALVPVIGYDAAAAIAHEAAGSDRTVRQVARERTDLQEEELDRLLDPSRMT